jgi:hypothetical protein
LARFPPLKKAKFTIFTMSASVQITASTKAEKSVEEHNAIHHTDAQDISSSNPEKHDSDNSATTIPTGDEAPIPLTERERHEAQLEKWNEPRINMWRVFGTMFSFIIMGMNDGAIGALIPYVNSGPLPFLPIQPQLTSPRSNPTITYPTQSSPSSSSPPS